MRHPRLIAHDGWMLVARVIAPRVGHPFRVVLDA
jgi:hypothetical protein